MNHAELVDRAIRWLKNSLHCRVVLGELVANTRSRETPDVIGWVFNRAILIECKTSKADFYADKRKQARRQSLFPVPALGHWRFYLTPPDLLREVTEGWGLYEVHDKRVIYKKGVEYANAAIPPFESDRDSEVAMLVSALARMGTIERMNRTYNEGLI